MEHNRVYLGDKVFEVDENTLLLSLGDNEDV
jgi:hypothetical protein